MLGSIWLALIFAATAGAQIKFDPERDVPLTADIEPAQIAAGGSGILTVDIALPADVHITARELGFFNLTGNSTASVVWGEASFPSAALWEGDSVYQGKLRLILPFTVKSSQSAGALTLAATLGYQICTEKPPLYCTPPVERRITAIAQILPATGGKALGNSNIEPVGSNKSTIEERARRALETGSLVALLWIFIGGVLLSFTPCVYPVIPITIAYIGARSGASRWKGFTLSLVFVSGLALMYSILGLIAAATGGVFGFSTRNPWVVGLVVIVFLVMGIGMLGAFKISLPSSLQTKMSSGRRTGYLGALLVGATTGLVAAPCVGPVLVALLGWVSSTGNLLAGFLYLFVFALGLGTLFVVIGTSPGR